MKRELQNRRPDPVPFSDAEADFSAFFAHGPSVFVVAHLAFHLEFRFEIADNGVVSGGGCDVGQNAACVMPLTFSNNPPVPAYYCPRNIC